MPQATDELRERWNLNSALEVMDVNHVCEHGIFMPRSFGQAITPEEESAMDYLFQEWDYGYESLPNPNDE